MKGNFNEKKQLRRVLVTENVMSLSQDRFVLQMKVFSTGLALGFGRRREGGLLCPAHPALRCPCSTGGDSMDSSGSSLPCLGLFHVLLSCSRKKLNPREFFKVGRRERGKTEQVEWAGEL